MTKKRQSCSDFANFLLGYDVLRGAAVKGDFAEDGRSRCVPSVMCTRIRRKTSENTDDCTLYIRQKWHIIKKYAGTRIDVRLFRCYNGNKYEILFQSDQEDGNV